jgi:putative addiction module component (TIGR02574 family)
MQSLGIAHLSKDQRIDLVLELCESIHGSPQSGSSGETLRQEILRRAKALEDRPEIGVEWEDVEQALDDAE